MAKLLVQESNGAREFELVDLEVAIGRELANTLRLADPSISRHHAVIRRGQAGFEIQDLQSSNGVLLNGARVPSALLQDGDRITLGQMQLTFVDPRQAGGSPLGTVRMSQEDMARFRADLAAAAGTEEAGEGFQEASGPDQAEAAPEVRAVRTVRVGPAFLRPYLPGNPDLAVPLQALDGSLVRGDFRSRLLAGLIDFSPMLALCLISWGLGLGSGPGAAVDMALAFLQLLLLVGYLVLMPLCWIHYGATPGKKIMGLRVVPEDDPAGRIDLSAAISRLFGYLVMTILGWVAMALFRRVLPGQALVLAAAMLAAAVLPYLMILGPERKGLEDRFSRSLVIKVNE